MDGTLHKIPYESTISKDAKDRPSISTSKCIKRSRSLMEFGHSRYVGLLTLVISAYKAQVLKAVFIVQFMRKSSSMKKMTRNKRK